MMMIKNKKLTMTTNIKC